VYETRPQNHATGDLDNTQPVSPPSITPHLFSLGPTSPEASLFIEVHRLIRATGQFVDDISARYFQSFHAYLPIVSRRRFHSSLITANTTPSAGFSVLLLSICLVTSSRKREPCIGSATNTPAVDRQSLYLTTRSIIAQVQGLFPPSIHLIQAGILLALYEYALGKPDDAFATIAGCARMAYATGIRDRPQLKPPRPSKDALVTESDTFVQLQAEKANTWWGVVICER
jgi:hypothetical protein